MATRKAGIGKWLLAAILLAVVTTAGAAYYLTSSGAPAASHTNDKRLDRPSDDVRVETAHPLKGVMPRTTTQPGSVLSFESADLYAGASGYLGKQSVDIGAHVNKGDLLAQVDVPDLVKQVQQRLAELEAANARVDQMNAGVAAAKAEVEAAKAEVVRAEKAIKSTHATTVFKEKQYQRMYELFHTPNPSIDERLVDEHQEDRDAAEAAEDEARAARVKADALVTAANAAVEKARADVTDAQAEVKVAQATLGKAQVLVDFASIKSPYEGVITRRTFFPGEFVRAASEGASQPPVLRVERTNKMRVIVDVPDPDVAFCMVGDQAEVELNELPGVVLQGPDGQAPTVSRMADSEDPTTRLMHVEIDVGNPTGKIVQGMYGHVTIFLDQGKDLLSVPSSCLQGRADKTGKTAVFVVRDGKAYQVPVIVGTDNGVRASILQGLTEKDEVVQHPSSDLADGAPAAASNAKSE
jgi:RND family efflux transporter MFP subunit